MRGGSKHKKLCNRASATNSFFGEWALRGAHRCDLTNFSAINQRIWTMVTDAISIPAPGTVSVRLAKPALIKVRTSPEFICTRAVCERKPSWGLAPRFGAEESAPETVDPLTAICR